MKIKILERHAKWLQQELQDVSHPLLLDRLLEGLEECQGQGQGRVVVVIIPIIIIPKAMAMEEADMDINAMVEEAIIRIIPPIIIHIIPPILIMAMAIHLYMELPLRQIYTIQILLRAPMWLSTKKTPRPLDFVIVKKEEMSGMIAVKALLPVVMKMDVNASA